MHTSFTALNDILLRSIAIVNDLYTLVYDTEKYDRNTEPCKRQNTVGYVPFVERLHQYTVVYGFRNPRHGQ